MQQRTEFLSHVDEDRETFDRIFDDTRYGLLTFPPVSVPTGRLLVGDPLVYLGTTRFTQRVSPDVAPGRMTLRLAVAQNCVLGPRYSAARVEFNDHEAVRYQLAELPWRHRPQEPSTPGFPVDAGLACFADEAAVDAFASFRASWQQAHPDQNIYDDYFAALFRDSAARFPQVQSDTGDFITWTVPGSEHVLIFFASGVGDGMYPVYVGHDHDDEVCNFTTLFFDPETFDWSGANSPSLGCIVSKRVANEGRPVGYLERGVPDDSRPDTGWLITAGDETPEQADDPDNYVVLRMDTVCQLDPAVIPCLKAPAGSAFVRDSETSFRSVSRQ